VFLPAPPKVIRVKAEQKGFSCHFNEVSTYNISIGDSNGKQQKFGRKKRD
jgi:hypothetical protein